MNNNKWMKIKIADSINYAYVRKDIICGFFQGVNIVGKDGIPRINSVKMWSIHTTGGFNVIVTENEAKRVMEVIVPQYKQR